MLSTNIEIKVYQACVLSTLLYGSEAWTLFSRQERKLNAIHLCCPCRSLGITRLGRITNIDVLAKAGLPSIYAILSQIRLRCSCHVIRMDDGCIRKDMLFRELGTCSRPTGRPALRYKDARKADLIAGGFDPTDLETVASDRSGWRSSTRTIIENVEEWRDSRWREKHLRRQHLLLLAPSKTQGQGQGQKPIFTCSTCNRQCSSLIGLYSHNRRCSSIK